MPIKDNNRVNTILESQWVLWAISVTLACSLWFYVHRTEGADYLTQKFSAPLEYQGADSQVRFLNKVTSVDVEVRGLEWRLSRFDPSTVIFYVDVRSVPVGTGATSPREVRCQGLPEGITVISRVPSIVDVRAVRENSNRMPVEFVLPDNIPKGQYVAKVDVNPREVLVSGTDRDIAKVSSLQVRPTLAELQSGKEVTLSVQTMPQGIVFEEGGVTLEPETVQLKGTLARGLPKKNVPINVRRVGKPHEDFEILDSITNPIEVQIEGSEALLARVTAVDTETVDVSMVSHDFEVVVPLQEPSVRGVSLTDIKSVQLTFNLIGIKAGKQLTNVPVTARNASSQLSWTSEPPVVTVSIEGVPSKIRNATAESAGVQAFVDLTDVFLDTIVLPVSVDIASSDFKVTKIEPAVVTLVTDRNNRSDRTRRTREDNVPSVTTEIRELELERLEMDLENILKLDEENSDY